MAESDALCHAASYPKFLLLGAVMTECIHTSYLKNGKVFPGDTFRDDYINKGKSIYEVTRLAGSWVMFLEDHINRFCTSLKLEGITLDFSREVIRDQISELIKLNSPREGNLKFVYNITEDNRKNFLVYFTSHRYPTLKDYERGVLVITYPFERIDPNKKIWRPAFRRNVAAEIKLKSAWEALLTDPNGFIPEASRSNLFAIKDGEVITSPDQYILTGITRKYVLEACSNLGIPVHLRLINLNEIAEMDSLFLTSTSLQLAPVCQVDNFVLPVNDQNTRDIMKEFDSIKKNHLRLKNTFS